MGEMMDGGRRRAEGSGAVAARRTGTAAPLASVLIVDDEPMIGTTLRVLLSGIHEVAVAGSGAAAREMLEEDPGFDLILCDLMMPNVSGMELHAWLNEHNPDAARRMVFMTGGVFTEDARQFLEDVPNRRIDKPFDPDDLLRLIDEELMASGPAR